MNDPAHAWTWGRNIVPSDTQLATLTCLRAPACAAAQPDAAQALQQLAQMVRHHPVNGMGRDLDGNLTRVHVDIQRLLDIAGGNMLNEGELAAASDALRAGDKQPLVRLAAEVGPSGGDQGDPAGYSAGDNAAAFCNDDNFVWSRSDPVPVRRAKYASALARLGPADFAPFLPREWASWWIADFCVRWPAPDRFTPAVPRGATVTGVPTLVLSGDLDTNVPTATTRQLLKIFPDATFLHVAGAAHPAIGWSPCADAVTTNFIRTLDASGASCRKPAYVGPATPAFPRVAANATPATSLQGDESTEADRRVVTVAVGAVLDAWLRSFYIPSATGTGYGLRGGTFDFDYSTYPNHALIVLHGARFALNVTVLGRSTWAYSTHALHLHLKITGPGTSSGTLSGDGQFGPGAPFSDFTIHGSLGGRSVVVSVPAN